MRSNARVHVVAVDVDRDAADLLRLAVRLAAADRRLLGRHRHEQRVLAFDSTVAGPHAEPARAEHRDTGAHVDGREADARERLRRLERRRQHRADRVGVGLPHDGHRGRPDLGARSPRPRGCAAVRVDGRRIESSCPESSTALVASGRARAGLGRGRGSYGCVQWSTAASVATSAPSKSASVLMRNRPSRSVSVRIRSRRCA